MEEDSRKQLIEDSEEESEFAEETNIMRAVNRALNGTAHLNNLLPTGTMLAFQVLCPVFSNAGHCDHFHKWLTALLLGFCGISSFFLSFTDSFRAPNGKIYYGIATPRGLWTFGKPIGSAVDASRYRLKFLDFIHAFLSVMVVVSLGLANFDVVDCFYPEMPRVYVNTVPVVAGLVISMFFVLFPTTRRGIGHPVMFHHQDSLYARY
eukprot:Gb_37046 [translate_table: standard]